MRKQANGLFLSVGSLGWHVMCSSSSSYTYIYIYIMYMQSVHGSNSSNQKISHGEIRFVEAKVDKQHLMYVDSRSKLMLQGYVTHSLTSCLLY